MRKIIFLLIFAVLILVIMPSNVSADVYRIPLSSSYPEAVPLEVNIKGVFFYYDYLYEAQDELLHYGIDNDEKGSIFVYGFGEGYNIVDILCDNLPSPCPFSGYDVFLKKITPSAVELEVLPAPGHIKIHALEGAKIWLDGDFMDTSEGDPIVFRDLKAGDHEILVSKNGYEDYTTTVEVGPGETAQVTARLERLKNEIYVTSQPSGSDVYFDGVYKGKTPLTIRDVTVGTHDFRITKEGYVEDQSYNYIGEGFTEFVVKLEPRATEDAVKLSPKAIEAVAPTTTLPTTPPQAKSETSERTLYGISGAIFLVLAAGVVLLVRKKRTSPKVVTETKPPAPKAETRPEKISGPAISVTGLSKSYKNAKILEGVDFQLEQGKLCAVVGPSGGGKSTIIESIIGRITPDKGKIQIMGMDVGKKKDEINKLVGFVPQHPELYMDQSVWQNMMNSALKWSVKDADAKSEKILKQLGIFERKEVVAKNLSGGQLKRLSLGMELIREPPILVLDEPTTGLDPTSRDQILSALSKIVFTDKKTAILTTHFMDEAEHCDEVIIVGNAKILAKGAPSELARRMPGRGKIVRVTLEEVGEDLVSKVEGIEGVKKVIREGRVLKIISDTPDPVELSQKIKEFGGTIEGSKVDKARMKEVFVYYTGVYPEE